VISWNENDAPGEISNGIQLRPEPVFGKRPVCTR
jgi:hypothetical protein